MSGKQAKILSEEHVLDLLVFADSTRHSKRNRVIVLLSVKAGLRAAEIAQLTWDMVLDPSGDISASVELRDHAAKNGSGRTIPFHPDLREALRVWRQERSQSGPVVRSERGGPMTPVSIVNWFAIAYETTWLERVLVAFWPTHLHHAGGTARSQGRRLIARRPVTGRPSINSDDTEVYRRRQRCAAKIGLDDMRRA